MASDQGCIRVQVKDHGEHAKVKGERSITLGVIGGSGPEAGINVVEKMLLLHKERLGDIYMSDKDAVSVILMQSPTVGGPHGTWDLEKSNTVPYGKLWENIKNLIWKLNAIEVEYFCIACNTLHVLEPMIRDWMKEEGITSSFISIVQSTKDAVVQHSRMNTRQPIDDVMDDVMGDFSFVRENIREKRTSNRVAIFGSLLTTDITGFSPYKSLFDDNNENNLVCVSIEYEARKRIQFLISETKRRGVVADLQNQFFDLINDQFVDGSSTKTDYIVLACTELPLLLSEEGVSKLSSMGIIVIDPNTVVANDMLRVGGYLR